MLKFFGIGLLYISLIWIIRFQLFFVLNWIVNVKNKGDTNSCIMWMYKRLFIYKFTNYIIATICMLLISFILINGFVYLIVPGINKITLAVFQGI
ncbi:hypothetical protein P9Z39_05490 [Bacillus thuringiensis]|nr:hypothetical protein [Bacillus thuringiensis]MEC2705208.1 hypothetical protein [Bacillus thuringiensis]